MADEFRAVKRGDSWAVVDGRGRFVPGLSRFMTKKQAKGKADELNREKG